ncbi:MAG TPA: ATP-binding protein [Ignavibacteriales bacterium]|nr:ATP-binding protein [Ignavibacteriales bacterium]
MPHGNCYFWTPDLVWLHASSDSLIGLSYWAITITLGVLVYKTRKDIPFAKMFVAFGIFIITCGTTHLMDVLTLWDPYYWLSGSIKLVTAVASVATAVALPPVIPRIISIIQDAKLSEQRRVMLQRTNMDLQAEIQERIKAQEEVSHLNANLEKRVLQRTAQLEEANRKLRAEISQRKKAELEIKQLNETLEQRVLERTHQLNETNRELEAFSYSVSHDLRAPLRGIDGFSLSLLEDYSDKLDEQARNYLARIRNASQRMGTLIEDMLNLSRLSRTQMKIRETDMSSIALEISEEFRRNNPERNVKILIEPGLSIAADENLLRIMLQNLIGNAWKFTSRREDALIEIGKTEYEGRTQFFVRDNGAGFNEEFAGRMFMPFQRLHTPGEFEGTGIGLAIVQRIVHRHGGSIKAEGRIGRGAVFYFYL